VQSFREATGVNVGSDAGALIRVREAAERAKILLSTARTATINVPFIAFADSTPLHLEVELARTRCNEITHSLVARTLQLSRMALEDAGETPGTINKVLAVGRAARAASISLALADLFGKRVRAAPDHIVALGAAVQAGVLGGKERDRLLLDSVTRTLRIEASSGLTMPIIVRNTTIPTRTTMRLTAPPAGDSKLRIRILAGESLWAEKNSLLVEFDTPFEVVSTELTEVELTLDIDANSVLGVSARNRVTSEFFKTLVSLRSPKREAEDATGNKNIRLVRWINPVRLGELSNVRLIDLGTVQRWVCVAFADLMIASGYSQQIRDIRSWLDKHPSGPLPLGMSAEVWFDLFSKERELLVDAIEHQFNIDLASVRYSGSPQSLSEKLLFVLNG